jgi:hypothetical protein
MKTGQQRIDQTALWIGAALIAAAALVISAVSTGCADGKNADSKYACTPGGPGSTDPETCDSTPLRTSLPLLWNGNSVDAYDCPILRYTAAYNEPDAMIFKAMLYVESRFQYDAVGCRDNGPCCPEIGWSAAECACLGAMQNGPDCGEMGGLGLRADGHPNMETNPDCEEFKNSIFNPEVNVEVGILRVSRNRERMKADFPGCTEDQYTIMAVGEYNNYKSTESCTVYNFDYIREVLEAYTEYSEAAGWPARSYATE